MYTHMVGIQRINMYIALTDLGGWLGCTGTPFLFYNNIHGQSFKSHPLVYSKQVLATTPYN